MLPDQKLGLGFSPPYLAPTTIGSTVLKGVNYASGAGGILNNSGKIFVSFCFNWLGFMHNYCEY